MLQKIILSFFLLISGLVSNSAGQSPYILSIVRTDSFPAPEIIPQTSRYPNTYERNKFLSELRLRLQEKGHLTVSIDSLKEDSLSLTAFLHLGPIYEWLFLKNKNVDEEVLSASGFREKIFYNKIFSRKEIGSLFEKIVSIYENRGYPFVSVRLDSININKNKISALLFVDKNQEYLIDSISVRGNAKITPAYLFSYMNLKPGGLYKEQLVRRIDTRLRELPFVTINKASEVTFTKDKVNINLFLSERKANQFDGVVGFLPDNNNAFKTVITGEAKLKLINSFAHGEQIDLNWRKLNVNTQDLKIRVNYPFLFSSPFGLDLNFTLYKKDTQFVDVVKNIGLQYLLPGGNYLKVFYTNKETNLVSTYGLDQLTSLPPYADVSSNIYGLSFRKEDLDYRLNPRKGYSVETSAAAGSKKITKNDKVPEQLYSSISLQSNQYNLDFTSDFYFPLSQRNVFNTGIKAAFLKSNSIFRNELYRFGGLRTLRGFNEESLYASSFGILKLEYRYLLETNSYLFAFWNGAWYENKSIEKYIRDTPYGFGAGMTFETKLGIFGVSYALGKEFNNPIFFRNGKIHFGIVNNF